MSNHNIQLNTNYKVSMFSVDYTEASWKYVLLSMLSYSLLQPLILPLLILLSRTLGRKIDCFPVYRYKIHPET